MSYVEQVIKATGGHAAPAEVIKEDDDSYSGFLLEFDDDDLQYLAEVGEDYEELEDEDEDRPPAPPGYHYMPDGTLMRDDAHSVRESLSAAGYLVPEEQDLADALLEIVEKHGKFNADNTGVWAGYTPAAENDNKEMGVKCGNCVFWEAPNGCKLIIAETEEGGLCRFAVLPDGTVNPKDKPVEDYFKKSPRLVQEELKKKIKEMENQYKEEYLEISDLTPTQETVDTGNFKDAEQYGKPVVVYRDAEGMKLVDGHHRCATRVKGGHRGIKAKVYQGPVVAAAAEDCPPATQDIQLNLENRQNAIENVGYGPLNPAEPNEEFWQDKADRWMIGPEEAKTSVCGNCVFFVRTPSMLECIEEGIGLGAQEAEGSIEAGELGYCNALDFKCASERTCNAWAAGGPITEESVTATAGSKPAKPKERIKGSKKNKKGSASGGKKINFSKKVTKALENKVEKHNEKHGDTASKKTSLRTLKAVYRRGAGAFSTSHRPDQNRNSWAMARVNAFLHLLRTGSPKNKKYVTDNDLLPAAHKRSTKKNAAITAAADPCWDGYKQVGMKKGKSGDMVPNCVPSSASIDYVVDQHNLEFGESRHVSKDNAYQVARSAADKYSYLSCEELSNAILWELDVFLEYSTTGVTDWAEEMVSYSSLLPAGHPSTESGVVASAEWISGAPELSESAREVIFVSLTETEDFTVATHATTRFSILASAGALSETTMSHIEALTNRFNN